MKITLKMLTGVAFEVDDLEPSDPVRELKGRMYELEGYEPDSQRIADPATKTNLDDAATLQDCGIADGTTLHILVAVKAEEETDAPVDDWREDKTDAQLQQYMLEHEVTTDVLLEVKDSAGKWVSIKAHSYMLTRASSVLEKLCKPIHTRPFRRVKLPDVSSDTIRRLLRFIYYGDLDLTSSNIIPLLLQSACKLKIHRLMAKCQQSVERNLGQWSSSDIMKVFDSAVVNGADEIAENVAARISADFQTYPALPECVQLSKASMERLLQRDDLCVADEGVVYQHCLRWAKARCEEDGVKVTDAACREALGKLLYLIRFPTMSLEQFGPIANNTAILTNEEKLHIYGYLAVKDVTHVEHIFSAKCRSRKDIAKRPGSVTIERFNEQMRNASQWRHPSRSDAIDFEVDKPICLKSVCFYTANKVGLTYDVRFELIDKHESVLMDRTFTLTSEPDSNVHSVDLDQLYAIRNKERYTIRTTLTPPNVITWYGEKGMGQVDAGGVRVTFYRSAKCNNHTNVKTGQIPGFLFHEIV